jgi:hypothetical protein
MNDTLRHYREIWFADFEFGVAPGEWQQPRCLVAREFRSGKLVRLWEDQLADEFLPPFDIGSQSLFVAYFATAELGCFHSLGWPMPDRILDLFAEFRCMTNGTPTACGNGLLGALIHFGFDAIDAAEKDDMRQLALRGGEYSPVEKLALLDYCQTDVDALANLLPAMLPKIDLPRALLRGRYMAAAARMEFTGTPIDVERLEQLRRHWEALRSRLVSEVDRDFGCFVPKNRKQINPDSQQGAAILKTAGEWEINPQDLAEAVDELWELDRQNDREHLADIAEAKSRSRLNAHRITQFERGGTRDYSQRIGLDGLARELAGSLPALGLGPGQEFGANYDSRDVEGELWELLRQPTHKPRTKTDPSMLREAAERVKHGGTITYRGPWSFSAERFADYLTENGIGWPRLESGALALDDETFRQMVKVQPSLAPLRELRYSLSKLRLFDLAVGADGRNRTLLSPFRAKTGRNQPSNTRFIFGPSCWLRGLIKPDEGRAVAYVDWSQQEFAIAAALSGDKAMMDAYTSGDPYLTFAKQAKAVPHDATKETHGRERELFKVCSLAVQYGMGAASLADRLNEPDCVARELLRLHQQTYPDYWKWAQAAVDHAMLHGWLWTAFGWQIHVGRNPNARSLANFGCQANGAEMMRIACCLATERGIEVCAPIHDALLVEADDEEIESTVEATQAAMAEASRAVLGGFELRSEAKIVRWPDRYMDSRGERMWSVVTGILDKLEAEEEAANAQFAM